MQKIIMPTEETKNFLEVFEMFVISQSAKGVTDVTIRNYRYHMKNIGNYMDVHRPFGDVTKRVLAPGENRHYEPGGNRQS